MLLNSYCLIFIYYFAFQESNKIAEVLKPTIHGGIDAHSSEYDCYICCFHIIVRCSIDSGTV